ncbi:MAG: rod shape-determining protein RodA [Bacteroidales bacterium]|nr:rod shape-determining protein RodA [Bacteroidales bacterium]
MSASPYKRLDWPLICCYLFLLLFGWLNVYSALRVEDHSIFDLSQRYGMHLVWIGISIFTAITILFVIPHKFYEVFSNWMYILMLGLLLATIFIGVEVKGSRSWLAIGSFRLQPAEFSKITTSLAIASLIGKYGFRFSNVKNLVKAFLVLGLPMLLILAEKETGSMLVYLGFVLVFFCEGMSGWPLVLGLLAILLFILTLVASPFVSILTATGIAVVYYFNTKRKGKIWMAVPLILITTLAFAPKLYENEAIAAKIPFPVEICAAILIVAVALFFLIRSLIKKSHDSSLRFSMICLICAIGFIFSVQFIFDSVLQPHQQARIESLLGIKDDPMGVGYNVHQSKIAIGSGGFSGKGFMHGTQTRFEFVPEQGTDFIFCTVGEEWGLIGTLGVLGVYLFMILRIFRLSSENTEAFSRIYGYCVASCLFMHVMINVSMTIGLMPVIGIPLPFMSYGGSSLLAFSILLFIFVRLDLERKK